MPNLVRNLTDPHLLLLGGENPSEPQADALKNFRTKDNKLSVYEVKDGAYDAVRLAVSVVAGADRLVEVHFVVFNSELVTELGILIEKTEGKTPDRHANDQHYDLQIGTPKKLGALTEAIIYNPLDIKRILQPEVEKLVVDAIKDGSIDKRKLNRPMRKALKESHPGLL